MKSKVLLSTWDIKSVDDENRILEGIASTPTPDSYNDIVEVDGIEFSLPMPFLNQHNSREPIGNVIDAKKSGDKLVIRAQIAPDAVAPYIATAWAQIKAGLVRGLSIGFSSIEEAYNRETGGFHILRLRLWEISAVTIAANSDCSITAIKSADAPAREKMQARGLVGPVRLDVVRRSFSGVMKSHVPASQRKTGIVYL